MDNMWPDGMCWLVGVHPKILVFWLEGLCALLLLLDFYFEYLKWSVFGYFLLQFNTWTNYSDVQQAVLAGSPCPWQHFCPFFFFWPPKKNVSALICGGNLWPGFPLKLVEFCGKLFKTFWNPWKHLIYWPAHQCTCIQVSKYKWSACTKMESINIRWKQSTY